MREQPTPTRTERGLKRVRVYLRGHLVADTSRPLLVWERPSYPTYYIPVADFRAQLAPTGREVSSEGLGGGHVFTVRVAGAEAPDAATIYQSPKVETLRDQVRLDWQAMDGWYEEDEEVFVHPRDPYTRIDALRSSKHVVIEVNGVRLAESRAPVVLYETGLIPRTYLPAVDVRRDLLADSDTVTRCPYKGVTRYFHLRAGDVDVVDVAWSYPFPVRESAPIAGLICFHDEKVDMTVDGVSQPRPEHPYWSVRDG